MATPWLNDDEQQLWKELIERNDNMDIIGTGRLSDPPEKRWGRMWFLMLVFKRCSTGVSFRDVTHGIMEPIAINQSLPYRLHPYDGESSIPFGIPAFPKNFGCVPIYYEKNGGPGMGSYADLMFLDSAGRLRNPDGFIFDNASAYAYATNHYGSPGTFFQSLQMLIFTNLMQDINRALSGHEAFPHGLGGGGGAGPGTEVIGGRSASMKLIEELAPEEAPWGNVFVDEEDNTPLTSSELFLQPEVHVPSSEDKDGSQEE